MGTSDFTLYTEQYQADKPLEPMSFYRYSLELIHSDPSKGEAAAQLAAVCNNCLHYLNYKLHDERYYAVTDAEKIYTVKEVPEDKLRCTIGTDPATAYVFVMHLEGKEQLPFTNHRPYEEYIRMAILKKLAAVKDEMGVPLFRLENTDLYISQKIFNPQRKGGSRLLQVWNGNRTAYLE